MHVGPRYIELFLHSTEETGGGPQTGAGATGGMKYGQPPQTQQGWGDNRAQVRRGLGSKRADGGRERKGFGERDRDTCTICVILTVYDVTILVYCTCLAP